MKAALLEHMLISESCEIIFFTLDTVKDSLVKHTFAAW